MSIEWFSRFGDIPGVAYTTPAGTDRKKLKEADERPDVVEYGTGRSLSWRGDGGSTSASPAHQRAFGSDPVNMETTALLRHVYETLELPGQVRDYHFAIQGVVDQLWSRRRTEPAAYALVERLALLDVDLIRTRPDTITNEHSGAHNDQPSFYRVTTFARLITLYEREGALQEALEVATFASRFEQHEEKRDELAERIATASSAS